MNFFIYLVLVVRATSMVASFLGALYVRILEYLVDSWRSVSHEIFQYSAASVHRTYSSQKYTTGSLSVDPLRSFL